LQPEFAHPYNVLESHAHITIASPAGGLAPLDQGSVEAFKEDKASTDFLTNKKSLWETTEKLSSFVGRAKEFEAIVYVGGHGPMFDLAEDSTSIALAEEFAAAGKVVSAVCHGPAALVNVKLPSGEYLVAGQPVTGFSNTEEDATGLTSAMPFLLETVLGERGGKYAKASTDWQAHVEVGHGGKLVTGQNPASATPLGEAVLKSIQA
jgi:putative intracellular protease/amidase